MGAHKVQCLMWMGQVTGLAYQQLRLCRHAFVDMEK